MTKLLLLSTLLNPSLFVFHHLPPYYHKKYSSLVLCVMESPPKYLWVTDIREIYLIILTILTLWWVGGRNNSPVSSRTQWPIAAQHNSIGAAAWLRLYIKLLALLILLFFFGRHSATIPKVCPQHNYQTPNATTTQPNIKKPKLGLTQKWLCTPTTQHQESMAAIYQL